MYKELINDYLKQNKLIIIIFILITLLTFPLESIIIPNLYSLLYTDIGDKLNKSTFRRIGITIIIVVSVWLGIQLFYYLKNWLLGKILPTYLEFVTKKLFEKIIKKYETNYEDIKISKNVARLFELARDMKDIFYYVSATLLPLILTVIVVTGYFLFVDWKIGLSVLISVGILGFVSWIYGKRIMEISAKREEQYFAMNDEVFNSFENLMNVYLNNEIETELEKTDKAQARHTDFYSKQLDEVNNMCIVTSIIAVIIFALVMGIAFFNLKNKTFNTKKFITVTLIIVYFLGFLIQITTWTPEELMRLGILKHSETFIQKILEEKDKNFIKNVNLHGEIIFDNIDFSFDNNKVFDKFNFRIPSNTRVALLGSSGSGKSTLMKLLLGFYPVNSGKILLNGYSVQDIDPKYLRSKCCYINQRTTLLNGSVIDNMKYGNDISDMEIVELLEKYELISHFDKLEDGVFSNVGDQGKNLSGGMQKIIINIRGILKNGDIIIFDEPLAGLDANCRKKMIKLIKDMTEGKTLIVITHDKEIFEIMDNIIDLDKVSKNQVKN